MFNIAYLRIFSPKEFLEMIFTKSLNLFLPTKFMPLTIFSDKVRFRYKSKNWQYQFDEIKELGLLKKKKKYFLKNVTFIALNIVAYYCMLFFNLIDMYYSIPAILCYLFIMAVSFNTKAEFVYFVFVKDIYQNEIKTKIAPRDRRLIGKQIDYYLDLQFERSIQRTA
ncbi:hypothetical protein [Flavobacterium sp. KACC 22763]|uniref:hypothetical protein n=1 Tax=Flavobacterium sp. KACC 22763 TaxID=3025668 RepID=UPI0023660207|nr:hypothetical protein [Flavobacterium sp. KACC 22763]WDF62376.1 hypothetical protein PQ463_12135 [Flavobacterium sp. KACC 22763]